MSERIARLRDYQRNIDRYENLLKTNLTELELQFLEKRLSEERFAIAMLQFMGPSSAGHARTVPGIYRGEQALKSSEDEAVLLRSSSQASLGTP